MKEQNPFVGIWELVHWTARQRDGQVYYPYGEDAIGQILYEARGHMMVEIMKKDRGLFASNDFLVGSADEVSAAYRGFLAYCGTYEVDAGAQKVIHHVRISSFPNWVGQDQVRDYEFRDNLLILRSSSATAQHELIWNKIG